MDTKNPLSAEISISSANFVAVCIVSTILVAIIFGLWYLYKTTYPSVDDISKNDMILFKVRIETSGDHNSPQTLQAFDRLRFDNIRYIFEVQSSFWATYLQAVVSIIIIGLTVILLVLKIINAESGLPIIATIGGAAIGKGIPAARSTARPIDLSRDGES